MRHDRLLAGLLLAGALLGTLSWARTAAATEAGQSYLALGLGQPSLSDRGDQVESWPDTVVTGGRDSSFAWKLFTGYQFTRWLAVETAWVDLGKSRVEAEHASAAPLVLSTRPRGVDISALLTLPAGERIMLFARGGVLIWHSRADASGTDAVPGASFPLPDEDGISAAAGAGAQWELGPRMTLRGEFARFLDLAGTDTDLWTISLLRRY